MHLMVVPWQDGPARRRRASGWRGLRPVESRMKNLQEDGYMPESVIAQKSPYTIELEEGKTYAWCACGRSNNQPLCDGSHKDTGFKPTVFTAEKSESAHMCGCKRTGNSPMCDGTHKSL